MYRKYEKIGGHKEAIKQLREIAQRKGVELSKVVFHGTVKVHGTNACLVFDGETLRGGKRKSFVDPTKGKQEGHDHYGFTQWVESNREALTDFMVENYDLYCNEGETLYIYGEWAGKGVQKTVAVSQLEKSFYAFDVCIETDEQKDDVWLDLSHVFPVGTMMPVENMYCITSFGKVTHLMDFEALQESQNFLHDITMKVEEACPVAHRFGVEGIGEGLVWTTYFEGEKVIMKTKGPKHSVTNCNTIAPVDEVRLKNVNAFVEYAATENRINQGIQEVQAESMQQMGALIKWVLTDINAEESAALEANGLTMKMVSGTIIQKIKKQFNKHIYTL